MDERKALASILDQLSIEFTDLQIERIVSYLDLLQKWNATYNLSAIRNRADMFEKHVIDSLIILPLLKRELNAKESFIDVGTGAGLPAFFVALFNPTINVTALDSAGKKIRFLQHVVRTLQIDNLHPQHERLENLTEKFAHIASRAFADLESFLGGTEHLSFSESTWWAMKGPRVFAELEQAGFNPIDEGSPTSWLRDATKTGRLALRAHCHKLALPGSNDCRYLVRVLRG